MIDYDWSDFPDAPDFPDCEWPVVDWDWAVDWDWDAPESPRKGPPKSFEG